MPTLEFKGKQHIYAHHLTAPYRPLVPDDERSLNVDRVDDNLIIHGDNLHALKALLKENSPVDDEVVATEDFHSGIAQFAVPLCARFC